MDIMDIDLIGIFIPPEDKSLPASMRCLYTCEKAATGAVDRYAVLAALRQAAISTPDRVERVEFVPGTLRGKKVGCKTMLEWLSEFQR